MTTKEGEHMTRLVRSLRNGQMTIPAEFRKRLGIGDDSLLQVTLSQGELHIKPLRAAERSAGSAWLKELYDRFAPVRAEAKAASESEINQAIDDAVAAVRRRHA
jgi:AbrB family looped-hinge helix DNA binding protein